MSTHYFSHSGGSGKVSRKSKEGNIALNLCFCIWCDLPVTECSLMRLRHETSTHYFSCSSGPDAVSKKSTLGHVALNLCFASRGICRSGSAF
jgi:hypothetical protein